MNCCCCSTKHSLHHCSLCFPAKNYWAKDLVFLVTSHSEVGMQAWINGYMGTHSSGKKKKNSFILHGRDKRKRKKNLVVGRIRTCAGRAQWISSPSP